MSELARAAENLILEFSQDGRRSARFFRGNSEHTKDWRLITNVSTFFSFLFLISFLFYK